MTNGEKSELYILNDTKMGLIKIPFSNLLQFNPMGETKDPDGNFSLLTNIQEKLIKIKILCYLFSTRRRLLDGLNALCPVS